MAEFLLEILSEEIPARMQTRAADDMKRLIKEGLESAGLSYDQLDTYAGPRRLTAVAEGLPAFQPDVRDERKGPNIEAPDKAIQGFLKANGLALAGEAEIRELPKGKFYFAVVERKGRPAAEVLRDIVENVFSSLPWPKSMRWATNESRWVRPLHNILCIFDGEIVPVSFGGLKAGRETVGHRFMAPEPISVDGFSDYVAKLELAFVLIESSKRKQRIEDGIYDLANVVGLSVPDDPGLLDEVTGLVEWPVPLLGTIDDAFMDVPAEVLTSAMRKHQKYFALATAKGDFANRFALVANIETPEDGRAVINGNERVLRARLSDAKFFWDQDRQRKLDSRVKKLSERVFQADLGTVLDKVERLDLLAARIAEHVEGAEIQDVRRAARLCKADLSTGMVGEFPDLQGIMGRYYAKGDGESESVCDAISEHYSPVGPSDTCPSAPVSVCIALADKIDTLIGFFGIEEKPTGSKDPYALRRATLGVIRLILENGIRLPLNDVFAAAHQAFGARLKVDALNVSDSLLSFMADRLKVHLKEQGVEHDHVSAVFAVGSEDDLVRLVAKVSALQRFLGSDDGANLLTAYKRAANIVRIEEKKDGKSFTAKDASDSLVAGEAKTLASELTKVEATVHKAVESEDYSAAMACLSTLRSPVDVFFEKVKVNADDPGEREANLSLLARIGATMDQVSDFSKVES